MRFLEQFSHVVADISTSAVGRAVRALGAKARTARPTTPPDSSMLFSQFRYKFINEYMHIRGNDFDAAA